MKVPTVGSLFAGIGGFDLGFERAGFTVRWQAEQDAQAQAVLRRRFPNATLYDDVRAITAETAEPVDVLCGGFPCQDVSIAGKREGLSGARTGLFWEIIRIARALSPRWMVLENVPGLLSSHGGRDFHTVLEALAECGFRRAYRILDSRYFGVAQRRRRVFLVLRAGASGDGAEAVLFEPPRRHGHSAASGEARARVAATLRGRAHRAGVNMPGRGGEDDDNLIVGPLGGGNDGIGRRSEDDPNLVVSRALSAARSGMRFDPNGEDYVIARSLDTHAGDHSRSDSDAVVAFTLNASHGTHIGQGHNTTFPGGVRHLTPLECERLQGFPDGWTCLCGDGHRGSSFCRCPDSPRYRQLGNAVTVPVAEWIARRLRAADHEVVAEERQPTKPGLISLIFPDLEYV